MGHEWIQRVIEALTQAGIRAQRGYPAGKIPCLESPVASICVQRLQTNVTTLAVWIYGPAVLGGAACEDAAINAADALTALGGECQVESCAFNGRAGVFAQVVYVTFSNATAPE